MLSDISPFMCHFSRIGVHVSKEFALSSSDLILLNFLLWRALQQKW